MKNARFVPLLALLGLAACGTKVDGELYIETGSYRTLEYAPEYCADGDHFGFHGVQLLDDEDRIFEFFRNGQEPGLAFYAPGVAAFELGPADCTTLVGELHREHNRTTDVGRVDGSLELDCNAPNGWHITGALSFRDCAEPEDEYDDECDDHVDVVVIPPPSAP